MVTGLKVAETAWAAVMVTMHVPVPVQAPLQPANVDPEAAAEVRVTAVPLAKAAEQNVTLLVKPGHAGMLVLLGAIDLASLAALVVAKLVLHRHHCQ